MIFLTVKRWRFGVIAQLVMENAKTPILKEVLSFCASNGQLVD
jgi:hypothetical protein